MFPGFLVPPQFFENGHDFANDVSSLPNVSGVVGGGELLKLFFEWLEFCRKCLDSLRDQILRFQGDSHQKGSGLSFFGNELEVDDLFVRMWIGPRLSIQGKTAVIVVQSPPFEWFFENGVTEILRDGAMLLEMEDIGDVFADDHRNSCLTAIFVVDHVMGNLRAKVFSGLMR